MSKKPVQYVGYTKMSEEKKKIAAIYYRVSTYDQSTGEYSSLDGQEDLLRRYCDVQGWEVYDIYKDSVSGSNLEREQLQRLLLDAEDKKFQILAATKLDRVSRSVIDFLELDKRLRYLGIDIVISTQNIDTTTPTGKMQRTILLAFAEFEKDMIGERTREKLFLQAQQGYWGGGHSPLGYDVKEKRLIVNSEEAPLVKRIFEYYLEIPSTSKVATKLNTEGYSPKQRITKAGATSGGSKFSKEMVKRLLNNMVNLGKIKLNDQLFEGLHNAIIDEELFNRVQKKMEESASDKYSTYQAKSELTLLGIMKCGYCAHNLTATSSKRGKTRYYKCTSIIKGTSKDCPSKSLGADDLENFIQRFLVQVAMDDDLFNTMYKRISKTSSSSLDQKNNFKSELIKNLSLIKKDKTNLTNKIMNVPELKEVSSITNKLKEMELKKAALVEQINILNKEIALLKSQNISQSILRGIFKDFNKIYSSLSIESKGLLNKLLFIEIISYNERGKKSGEIEL